MNRSKPEEEAIIQLNKQAEELAEKVAILGANVGVGVSGLRRRTSRHSRVLWLLGGSFALDIILTIAIAFTGAKVMQNADDIKGTQDVVNSGVLCPLYDIFIASEKSGASKMAEMRQTNETEAEHARRLKERRESFKVIHEGHTLLKCDEKERK